MDNAIVNGFNLTAVTTIHKEIGRMLKNNQLLMGNQQEILSLSLWGRNFLQDMSNFLGLVDTRLFDSEKDMTDWSKLLNQIFLLFSSKVRLYFGVELEVLHINKS